MFEEWLVAWNDMILQLGSFINGILSIPSKLSPLLSSNMILIVISVLFGYFYGKYSKADFKILVGIIFSILFYCTIKFIGGA